MLKPNLIPRYQRRARAWIRKTGARGVILCQGKTLIPKVSGEVLSVLTFGSGNSKLGAEFQTYHLNASEHPTNARRYGSADACICGDCPFRAKAAQKLGPCYVDGRGIASLWGSIARGNYPTLSEFAHAVKLPAHLALQVLGSLAHGVRLGAYGDPVSMPVEIAQALCTHAATRQGFTHQWRALVNSPWRMLTMASCETPEQPGKAAAAGWRTYTVYPKGFSHKQARQALTNASPAIKWAHCPGSAVVGYLETCETCPIQCDGARYGQPLHVINQAHGNPAAMARYKALNYDSKWAAWL